ncbi:cytochrome P450 [Streptomyces sp. NPDC059524]|uniref:cytochrome P450 n=1 Tax=Streptomyces sp. NPDC059524 TaxID=3346856 RepID=UPI0036AB218C
MYDEPFGAWLLSRHADVTSALTDPRLVPLGPGGAGPYPRGHDEPLGAGHAGSGPLPPADASPGGAGDRHARVPDASFGTAGTGADSARRGGSPGPCGVGPYARVHDELLAAGPMGGGPLPACPSEDRDPYAPPPDERPGRGPSGGGTDLGHVDPAAATGAPYAWPRPAHGHRHDPRLTPGHPEDVPRAARRALLSPALQDRALAALAAGAERTAHVLARRLARRQEADLVAEFCRWLPAATVVAALGLPHETTAHITARHRTALGTAALHTLLRPHAVRRRAHPGTDLLSVLCAAPDDDGPLSDTAVTGLVAVLLGAGGQATDGALAALLANLLDHPAQLDLVRADPELADAAWTESLRRDPAAHIVLRRALAPVPAEGGTIPAGATVACLAGAAGRDAARFADPDRYDLFRTPADPGPACLGARLARLTARTGLHALLSTFPHLRWAPGFRPTPEGLLTRAPSSLRVHLG